MVEIKLVEKCRYKSPRAKLQKETHIFVINSPKSTFFNVNLTYFNSQLPRPSVIFSTFAVSKFINMQRNPKGHKGTFGHALLIAGQWGMAGASILAAEAALRSGIGKITVHTPLRNNDILQIAVPEAIIHHDCSPAYWTEPVATLSSYQAVAIGPGIGTHPDTANAFIHQLENISVPLVLDADALNILAQHPDAFQILPPVTILTPHLGEFHRIEAAVGLSPEELVKRFNIILVLKGHPTKIFYPNGTSVVCPYGNDGMATAGSGDVLTGVILGFLTQGYSPTNASRLGVFLHSYAGDLAANALGHHSMLARDIITFLPEAIKEKLGNEICL